VWCVGTEENKKRHHHHPSYQMKRPGKQNNSIGKSKHKHLFLTNHVLVHLIPKMNKKT
jgi:hypothetical protein